MAVVGRGFAIADLPRFRLWGFPGWVVWALFHLAQIVEFENRVLVFVQWIWSYWTRNRSARLIIGRARRPADEASSVPRADVASPRSGGK
jgi:NADH dehydrogenase